MFLFFPIFSMFFRHNQIIKCFWRLCRLYQVIRCFWCLYRLIRIKFRPSSSQEILLDLVEFWRYQSLVFGYSSYNLYFWATSCHKACATRTRETGRLMALSSSKLLCTSLNTCIALQLSKIIPCLSFLVKRSLIELDSSSFSKCKSKQPEFNPSAKTSKVCQGFKGELQ